MTSVNEITLIGNLGQDPEVKETQGGGKMAIFSVATNETYLKNGERVTNTTWHRCVAFGGGAVTLAEKGHLKKGDQVIIAGRQQNDSYEKDGERRYTSEVIVTDIFLDSMNQVALVGHLGQDPEIRATQSGKEVASFSVATNESYKAADGTRKENVTWHRVAVFGGGALTLAKKHLKKGNRVFVRGRLRNSDWTDQNGVTHRQMELIASEIRPMGPLGAKDEQKAA